ncbi:MAG: Cof-type HAD-IIB family hydrolase [Alphaproteobacteria bacterium]|jgi:HAD superfamily hydrolase (TIGR01484 family)|nr:Cof-type HAD-IIB family hydrolase [Alphaproteobacteria bacterium]MBU1552148.1 Cof-type HAD-IIB family hydrolase [Alphaproteobacteria bacterium]MBU2336942.1 Cof-type HAD-IIB family hydrolase [Alphaproteobacteria bacterium]MBU2389699.1 Cof-type HAD-IIB family hydrolase [Alphaproteobacteria bacterium]
MFFCALAADFDGTVAHHGGVDASTLDALLRLKNTGRFLILVTGREINDLRHALSRLDLFDLIVAENGGVIYDPQADDEVALAAPPAAAFVQKLMERKVEPLSIGRTIVATWHPHEGNVLAAIEELGLELQIIFNKGAIMVLPGGINKATGLAAALRRLGLLSQNVVGVGDAENDHAFLKICGCSAAVANAISSVKSEADVVLKGDHGAGIVELVDRIIDQDLAAVPATRHGLTVGRSNGTERAIQPTDVVLIIGSSGSGKSSFATLLIEQMETRQQQYCIVDPEGDYETVDDAYTIGSREAAPSLDAVRSLLSRDFADVIVNMSGVVFEGRSDCLARLLPSVLELKQRYSRPHWMVIDEAHHFPESSYHRLASDADVSGMVFVTMCPETLPCAILHKATVVISVGLAAPENLARLARRLHKEVSTLSALQPGQALLWRPLEGKGVEMLTVRAPKKPHFRHGGKYAVGDVGHERGFYFDMGGFGRVARNLSQFLEIANHVDDRTWEQHLRNGDFTRWFEHVIRDEGLARASQQASSADISPAASRHAIHQAILGRYKITADAERDQKPRQA